MELNKDGNKKIVDDGSSLIAVLLAQGWVKSQPKPKKKD